jgi:hypothetical protein
VSFNPTLDRAAIDNALRFLGTQVRAGGTLYIFGGTALIMQGIRTGVTQDIDLWTYTNFAEIDQAIQLLKRQHISIDFIDPETFLPLPPGWEQRSPYVGTYGALTVYALDPYTIALTKIDRGQSRDRQDIQALASQGMIQRDELLRLSQMIIPLMGGGQYGRLDPAVFGAKVASMIQQITW